MKERNYRKTIESAIGDYLLQHRLMIKGTKISIPQDGCSYEIANGKGQFWKGKFQLDDTAITGSFECQFESKDKRYLLFFHRHRHPLKRTMRLLFFHRPKYSMKIVYNKLEHEIVQG